MLCLPVDTVMVKIHIYLYDTELTQPLFSKNHKGSKFSKK